ncbi:MAG: hypothetical protein U0Y82_02000 [Thermoleophilia bacterium]
MPRHPAILVCALVALGVTGCGGSATTPTSTVPTPPLGYVHAVQALLAPPAQLASLASGRTGPSPAGPVVSRRQVDDIMAAARQELGDFRAMRLTTPMLRRQRDSLAGAYDAVIFYMDRVGRDLVQDDRTALTPDLRQLLTVMRGMSSAAKPSPSSSRSR